MARIGIIHVEATPFKLTRCVSVPQQAPPSNWHTQSTQTAEPTSPSESEYTNSELNLRDLLINKSTRTLLYYGFGTNLATPASDPIRSKHAHSDLLLVHFLYASVAQPSIPYSGSMTLGRLDASSTLNCLSLCLFHHISPKPPFLNSGTH